MPKSLLKLLLGMIGMLLAASVSALGMGGIQVMSALGQPLKAEIELLAVGKMEKASLVARLASADAYSGAGLEFPHANKYSFKLEYHPDGSPYLAVRSEQPVNDPFVSLLVDVTWASGRLLREYTFLLDPPGYTAPLPEPAQAEPVALPESAPAAAVTPQPSEAPVSEVPEDAAGQPEPIAEVLSKEQAPVEEAAPSAAAEVEDVPAKSVAAKAATPPPVTVQRGDTLRSIAAQYKPEEVSLERMLVALYRVNAQQFDGNNMNRMQAGKILRLPDADDVAVVGQAEANREIRAQVADWNVYRQRLASAAPTASAAESTRQQASGRISSAVADRAPVASESAKEVLKLSKGEAPGDQVNTGGKGKAAERADAVQENRIAEGKAQKEEVTRQALLEKNLDDMRRLAELKSEMAALTQAASAPEAASAVKPTPPVKKPRPVPPPAPVVEEPSFVDMLLEEPLYLAAGAAVILLGAGGLGYSLWRRRKQAKEIDLEFEDELPETADTRSFSAGSAVKTLEDAGDFTHLEPMETEAPTDIDPLSEADLYLNFGRYGQAEKILKEALARTPAENPLILKLLAVYAASKNIPAFAALAERTRSQLSAAEWSKVQSQGRTLESGNPLYVDAGIQQGMPSPQAAPVTVPSPAAAEKEPELDFDLGKTRAREVAAPKASAGEPAIPELAEDAELKSLMASMGAAHLLEGSAVKEPETVELESMPPLEPVPAEPVAETSAPTDDTPLAFDIDFKLDEPVQAPITKAAPAPEIPGLGEISLSLEDVPVAAEPMAEEKPSAWYDVQTKLDLARAYREMGDLDGAREVLEEALSEGDDEQRVAARNMLDQLQ